MAYRRRYFAALTITTTAYGEKSVTTDKLADKAVTPPKVAPSAIDSEHVLDESLKSEDIKDGQIKNSDLAPDSVTTEKILDGAVTTQKLEASIQGIARPLTPGVDTAEIQDAKVTLAKLAPDSVDASKIKSGAVGPTELAADAVEESRVKDGAISRAKIAGSAIDATKIAVNAVTGSEILNRSVGTTEIAVDGVQTENVKNAHITTEKINLLAVDSGRLGPEAVIEPKLATAALALRHKESFNVRTMNQHDDFFGASLSSRWRKRIDAGGYIYWQSALNGLLFGTPATTGKRCVIDWDESGIVLDGLRTGISFYIPQSTADRTYLMRQLGLMGVFAENYHILFTAEDVVGAVPNWFARCLDAGAPTSQDTGVALTEAPQVLTIDYISDESVKFYIDGIEVAEITTNIPSGTILDPFVALTTRANALKTMHLQMVSFLRNRPAYA